MKKLCLVVILALCICAISFSQTNGGTFTLTGIPSQYNGKYTVLIGDCRAGDLYGYVNYDETTDIVTLPRIVNGRVTIPMWIENDDTDSETRYSGNHTADIAIVICDSVDGDNEIAEIEFEDVAFRDGSAAKSWNEGEVWD